MLRSLERWHSLIASRIVLAPIMEPRAIISFMTSVRCFEFGLCQPKRPSSRESSSTSITESSSCDVIVVADVVVAVDENTFWNCCC